MKRHILVVDDHPAHRELLSEWLEGQGYEVSTASDLKGSFAALQHKPPDAVLLDVRLGAEDGLALAAWVREQPALNHIPIIAVTAHAMLTEKDRILRCGCNAYVSKPVEFELLRKLLESWLP